jgi:hypothetical protein
VMWASVAWGTVPDWLAAVGTVGAFAATIVILGIDRRQSKRAPAQAIVLWTTRRFVSTSTGDHRFVTVHAYNMSTGPVPVANIVSTTASLEDINEVVTADERGFKELAPGAKTEVEIEVTNSVDDSELLMFFVDYLGGHWVKRVSDGRLMSARRGRKLTATLS